MYSSFYLINPSRVQYLQELKRVKQELVQTKAERDLVQKGAFSSEQTEELQGLSNLMGSASRHRTSAVDSSSKRAPRIPLSSSRKRCPESPITEEVSTEKENLLNKKQKTSLSSSLESPGGSAKKKRGTNPFSSVKKAARRTKKTITDGTPTKQYMLGDSEPTADVTGECNQS